MTTTAQCPVCGNPQAQGLLDDACTTRLERALGDVRSIVGELDTTLSKQARIGNPSGGGGLARERNPIHLGAMEAGTHLLTVLDAWARGIVAMHATTPRTYVHVSTATSAAAFLLGRINELRRHPDVDKLMLEVTDAVEQARRAIDRPADRAYLGQCYVETEVDGGETVTCYAEVWAKIDATETTCRTCGITHDVAERRAWLLLQAADMLTTVKEASRYIGRFGGIDVTEASIRGLLHRKRLAYRAETRTFRLGDLLDVLTDRAVVTSAGDAA